MKTIVRSSPPISGMSASLFLVGEYGCLIAGFRVEKIDAAKSISQYFAISRPR